MHAFLARARSARSLAFVLPLTLGLVVFACGGSSGDSPPPAGDAATDAATETSTSAPGDGGQETQDAANDAPSSNDSGSDADTSSQEKLICDAFASRSACPGGALPCDDDVKCIYGKVMLPEAAKSFAACRGAPSCKGDDLCVDEAGKSVGGAAASKYTTDCLARHTACSNGFKDDLCAPALFAYPNAGAGAQACLTKDCAQIESCIESLQAIKDIAACK
jgi:hypothetical protein